MVNASCRPWGSGTTKDENGIEEGYASNQPLVWL